MDHTYFAEISWDGEAGVWYVSDTDFPGLALGENSRSGS